MSYNCTKKSHWTKKDAWKTGTVIYKKKIISYEDLFELIYFSIEKQQNHFMFNSPFIIF